MPWLLKIKQKGAHSVVVFASNTHNSYTQCVCYYQLGGVVEEEALYILPNRIRNGF